MPIAISAQEFQALDNAGLDDLYGQLGLAEVGAGPSATDGLSALNAAQAAMVGPALSWDWLVERGKAFFEDTWPTVRSIICTAYAQYSETNKDWIEQVATALLAVINVGSAIAVLIVKIAIKKGLDALCAV